MSHPRLTDLNADGWALDDGEQAHAGSPNSYWIPPAEVRRSLQTGQLAKLRFFIRVEDDAGVVEDARERMWVEVCGRVDSWYRGKLLNQPACTDEISPGLEVWFQPRHVIDILAPDDCRK